MFQRYALRGLLLFVVTSCLVKAEVLVDDDIEAVVIQGKLHIFIFIIPYFITIILILIFHLSISIER